MPIRSGDDWFEGSFSSSPPSTARSEPDWREWFLAVPEHYEVPMASAPTMDVARVREIAGQLRELGLPEATVKKIEHEANTAEEHQQAEIIRTGEEVQELVVAAIDPNGDGVVDYPADAAAFWAMAKLHDLGLIRTGQLRRPYEPA